MRESDPTVLRRLIALRQVSAFSTAALDELATLADNAAEAEFAAGAEIAAEGARVPRLQLVLEGKIEMADCDGRMHAWGPHEVFGLLEVLAGRPTIHAAVAVAATKTLQLSGVELADLLEDNIGVLVAMLRSLARNVAAVAGIRARRVTLPTTGALGLVERLILLRQQPLLARANLQALSMLAQVSAEQSWEPGTSVARADEVATEGVFVLEGTLRSASGEIYGPGDSFGLVKAIAGLHHSSTITAMTQVRAMTSSGIAVFDVLEDHTNLGLAMLESLAITLLDHPVVSEPETQN